MATKKATKKTGDERKQEILNCAAQLVGKHGAVNITRRMVAKHCKVSESLVAHYFGNTADAQKKYRAAAKKLGITEPSKEQIATIGEKLRAHGPRAKKVVRKKTKAPTVVLPPPPKAKKVVAKKSAGGVKRVAKSSPAKTAAKPRQVASAAKPAVAKKTAARAPKAPPSLPVDSGLPPLTHQPTHWQPLPPPPAQDA